MICSKLHLSIFTAWLVCCASAVAQWDAPSNYYSNATGTGATLKSQLTSAMTAGHIQRTYGNFRYSAAIHDQEPANSSRIILAYSGLSNSSAWDSAATWNREHVWPQSKQPGSASNGTQGNLGDPHALRPCNTQVNSDRGSMPFGFGNTTGNYGDLGTYWFVGDMCRGDIARSLFYSETRYSGLQLVNGNPSGNQMGDLASLIEWHYLDPPDEFERRRNHTIFSSQYNPQYYTNNRNAYVDHPEFVWSIYKDQSNDSTITIAGVTSNSDGSSMLEIDLGTVIVGTAVSPNQTVTLNKAGNDGTYYLVEAVGDASSDREGASNAFRMNGTDSSTMNVSLAYNQGTAGIYDGMIIIDNLDVTTGGGIGNGANDGNDLIDMSLRVLNHANGSFTGGTDTNSTTVDLGEIPLGQPITPLVFSIHNLASQAGAPLTAAMELDSVNSLPQTSFLSFSGQTFADLAAGQSVELSIEGTPSALGAGTTFFQIRVSDEDIPGATQQTLQMFVTYDVVDAFLLGDADLSGAVDFQDIPAFIAILLAGDYLDQADVNRDGAVDFADIPPFIAILTGQ